jgi:uncharacterized protein
MQTLTTSSPRSIYLEHLSKGELAFQVSPDGRAVFFPRVLAPGTGKAPLEWRVSEGVGTVYATTTVFRRGEPPLNVALVDLDEGFRMMSRVEGMEAAEVRIGMRVRAHIGAAADGEEPYPVFVPLGDGADRGGRP